MPKTFKRKRLICQLDCKDDIEDARILGREEMVSLVNKYMLENQDLKNEIHRLKIFQDSLLKGASKITKRMYELKAKSKTATPRKTPTPKPKNATPKKTSTPKPKNATPRKTPTPKPTNATPGKTANRRQRSTPTATRKMRVRNAFAGVFK